MTNEHCIMKLNQLIESRKRIQKDLHHRGAFAASIESDIAALQHAVEQLKIIDCITGKEVDNSIKPFKLFESDGG